MSMINKPIIVGMKTFMSMIDKTVDGLKARTVFNIQHFSFYEELKFHAQLSWAWKNI